jgi:hypothetical protein
LFKVAQALELAVTAVVVAVVQMLQHRQRVRQEQLTQAVAVVALQVETQLAATAVQV